MNGDMLAKIKISITKMIYLFKRYHFYIKIIEKVMCLRK